MDGQPSRPAGHPLPLVTNLCHDANRVPERWAEGLVAVAEDTLVDFALIAFREDEQWQVGELPARAAEDLHSLLAAIRQQPSEGARVALCSYGDDFFLAARPDGQDVRLLISDVTAVGEWPVARQVLEMMEEVDAAPDDLETVQPAGDLEIFADLGLSAMELSLICSDMESYPDEMLTQITARIGFGAQFEQAVDADLS
jgi:putative tRNA adenosine deaminase-associated protein